MSRPSCPGLLIIAKACGNWLLGKQHGLLGLVFRKAQNKIQDPAKPKRLISDLLDQERWMILSADIKGDAYAGLLERNARHTKSGAGK